VSSPAGDLIHLGARLTSTTARYEEAGYAKLVVVLACKSHDSANLVTGHLEIKTGFRHRSTRWAIFNLAYI
jgi:hypothetical protein